MSVEAFGSVSEWTVAYTELFSKCFIKKELLDILVVNSRDTANNVSL